MYHVSFSKSFSKEYGAIYYWENESIQTFCRLVNTNSVLTLLFTKVPNTTVVHKYQIINKYLAQWTPKSFYF